MNEPIQKISSKIREKERVNMVWPRRASTVPPSSLACLWNMKICGNMATASRYIENVQQVSEKNSLLRDLEERNVRHGQIEEKKR